MNNTSGIHDDAFAALQAADPTFASNQLEGIRKMVDTSVTPIDQTHSDHAQALKKRPSWLAPSAVAATVALALGSAAGYSVAAAGDRLVDSSSSISMGVAPGAANVGSPGLESAASTDKMMAPYFPNGRIILKPAESLSNESGTAVGYVISDKGVKRKDLANTVASVFGLKGVTSLPDGAGYVAGDDKYVAANATVNGSSDPLASWYYNNPENSPWGNCAGDVQVEPLVLPSNSAGSSDTLPAPAVCEPISGTAPSSEAAITQAQEIFAQLGLGKDDATWSAKSGEWFGADAVGNQVPFVHVEAALLVGGLSAGISWAMDIGPEGRISSANGIAAKLVETAAYDIVSPKEAALRSTDIKWTTLGPTEKWQDGQIYPLAYADAQVKASGTTANKVTAKKDAEGRPLIAFQTETITVNSSQLTLVNYYTNDGTMVLLPGYELSGEDRTFTQIAIADKYISK